MFDTRQRYITGVPILGTSNRKNVNEVHFSLKWLTGFEGGKLNWFTLFFWFA